MGSRGKVNIRHRLVLDVVILLSAFLLPWWIVLALGLLGVFFFEWYMEFVVASIIIDLIYGLNADLSGYVYTIASVLILVIFELFIRSRLYWYE